MKLSLVALTAFCAVTSSAFALQDLPDSPPPRRERVHHMDYAGAVSTLFA